MAQQTINVGAAPNDGTGTPLRTAFQYTNSNFTELYTAVGPSGNNIVVPGTATITGDLTVDTSTLKVDSTNNRVGIGTATPGNTLHVIGGNAGQLLLDNGNQQYTQLLFQRNSALNTGGDILIDGTASTFNFRTLAANMPFVWQLSASAGSPTTAMTLNSTGLGVGGSPTSKLAIFAGADGDVALFRGGSTRQVQLGTSATAGYINTDNVSVGLEIRTNNVARAYVDTSGNVGIGVTPVNMLTIGTGTFNASTVSGSSSLYSTVAQGLVILADGLAVATRGGVNKLIANSAGDIISSVTGTAPSLTDNGYMVFNLTSNTNLRISVRGTDGTTRTANLTLA